MCEQAHNRKLQLSESGATVSSFEDAPGLEVNVVFTTERGTAAALRTAGSLARQLNAGVRLLVTQVVPYALPLDRPKVAVGFIQDRCRSMALECTGVVEIRVNVYLCRNRPQALQRVLRANSLVIVGGRRRWWRTPEQTLAKMLEGEGHQVIFADLRSDRPRTEKTSREDVSQGDQPGDTQPKLAYDDPVSTRNWDQKREGAR
jgi:hypothetical protein